MKNIQRMVLMVLVCWGMMVGKSYGQNVPTLTENNLVKIWDKTYRTNSSRPLGTGSRFFASQGLEGIVHD